MQKYCQSEKHKKYSEVLNRRKHESYSADFSTENGNKPVDNRSTTAPST